MTDLPELHTARMLRHDAERRFYILSDGRQRFFASERFFPNGIKENELVTFTTRQPAKGQKFPAVASVVFEPELEKA
jgi:hypothetical protein